MPKFNLPIMMLAIVLSTFLWFIRFGKEIATPGLLPVKLGPTNVVGLPNNLAVYGEIPGIKIELLGAAEQVAKAQNGPDPRDLITIDLSTARPGTFSYPLQYNSLIRPLVQSPRSILVTVEEIVTKPVPVVVELKGKLGDPSYRLSSDPVSDNTATIKAPKHIAEKITAARAILDLSRIDATNPAPQEALLVAVGDRITYDATIDPFQVKITPITGPAGVQKIVVVSPDIEGTPAVGYIAMGAKVTPSELQLEGPAFTLNNTPSVKTAPIDINGLTATKWFTVKLLLPGGTTSDTKVIHVRYDIAEDTAVKRSKTKPSTSAAGGNGGTGP